MGLLSEISSDGLRLDGETRGDLNGEEKATTEREDKRQNCLWKFVIILIKCDLVSCVTLKREI